MGFGRHTNRTARSWQKALLPILNGQLRRPGDAPGQNFAATAQQTGSTVLAQSRMQSPAMIPRNCVPILAHFFGISGLNLAALHCLTLGFQNGIRQIMNIGS